MSSLKACHFLLVGAHHSGTRTVHKILQRGFYLPSIYKIAHDFSKVYNQCQHQGNILGHQELSMTLILELELFDM